MDGTTIEDIMKNIFKVPLLILASIFLIALVIAVILFPLWVFGILFVIVLGDCALSYVLSVFFWILLIGMFIGYAIDKDEEINKKIEKKTRDDGCYEL
jgi:uncharacterized protein YacL